MKAEAFSVGQEKQSCRRKTKKKEPTGENIEAGEDTTNSYIVQKIQVDNKKQKRGDVRQPHFFGVQVGPPAVPFSLGLLSLSTGSKAFLQGLAILFLDRQKSGEIRHIAHHPRTGHAPSFYGHFY